MTDTSWLRHQQQEYVRRVEAHKLSTWPAELFQIINAAIDLHFGTDHDIAPDRGHGLPKLRVVR